MLQQSSAILLLPTRRFFEEGCPFSEVINLRGPLQRDSASMKCHSNLRRPGCDSMLLPAHGYWIERVVQCSPGCHLRSGDLPVPLSSAEWQGGFHNLAIEHRQSAPIRSESAAVHPV